jgi:leader peptidase (prepilin peptidase)/N-methyltransferase
LEIWLGFEDGQLIEALIAGLFGLLIGSFLNVCIYRWPRDLSVVKPRSHCPYCEKMIAWYDNVPVLSYLLLGARCRQCREPISVRYPLVEAATGALFFYFIRTQGLTPLGVKSCVMGAILVALIVSDLETRILPDEFTKGGIVAGLIFAFFVPTPDNVMQSILWLMGVDVAGVKQSVIESAAGAALPALFLWGGGWLYLKLRHKEGLGFGDVKLIAMVGAFLGLRGALLTLIFGSVVGTLLGYAYIKITGKDTATYELPFGTFLGAAALAMILGGSAFLGL